jgi:hypothetical protein
VVVRVASLRWECNARAWLYSTLGCTDNAPLHDVNDEFDLPGNQVASCSGNRLTFHLIRNERNDPGSEISKGTDQSVHELSTTQVWPWTYFPSEVTLGLGGSNPLRIKRGHCRESLR